MNPVISILTPAYRAMPFLERAVASTAPYVASGVVEHIVMDGGSTDGTVEFLEGTSTIWRSAPDKGQSDALNTALSLSSADWIGWLNADEYYLDGVLDRIIELLRTTTADVIYGDYIEITPDQTELRLVTQHSLSKPVLERFGLAIPSCTTFIRKKSIVDVGGWNENSKTVMDWELWLGILYSGGVFHYTGKPHAAFTRHEEQASTRLSELVAREHGELNEKFGISDSRSGYIKAKLMRITFKIGNGSYLRSALFKVRLRMSGTS